MSLPFRTPAPTELTWREHGRELTLCRGAACFTAAALHFGTDSPKALEQRIDGRGPYINELGDRSWSGKYRRWLTRGTVPSDETVERVKMRSEGAVDLSSWRDLVLWSVLEATPPSLAWLHTTKERFSPPIRTILFGDPARNRMGRFIHFDTDRDRLLALRDLRSLEALCALLCLAREGELLGDDARHSLPTMCAFDILARVLRAHPPLRFKWQLLYACLERVFFARVYGDGICLSFSAAAVERALGVLDQDARAELPQLSGRRKPTLDTPEAERPLEDALEALAV